MGIRSVYRPVDRAQSDAMTERILGLVGGLGPDSTVDYYRRLIDGYHARLGPLTHPRIVIDSLDGGPLITSMVAGDLGPLRDAVSLAVDRLAAAGAGLAMICSVASHQVFDAVAQTAPIPILSIIEATCRATIAAGVHRPALFGTRMAVDGAFFARVFEEAGIDLARPAEADRAWINEIYLGELIQGLFLDATRDQALEILARLRRDDGIDGLILAGTELSVLLPQPTYAGVPVLNAAAIHVAEGLDWLIG
jgi:aspartate racemase